MDVHVGGSMWLFIGVYMGLMYDCRHVCGVTVSVYVYIGLVYGFMYVQG